MQEIIANLHMHTLYSDGTGSHADIAAAALRRNQDVVIVTDHNVLVKGFEGYVRAGRRKVLMLVGEEVHDQDREPQKNHLLVLGADHEMATFADHPATLIKAVRDAGGLSFIAHPTDPAAPLFNEPEIQWVDWSVRDFTGIEIWNGFSELKTVLATKLHGAFYAFFPWFVARGPMPATLEKWDELLANRRVVAIGGSDAHALHLRMGPLRRTVFPYDFHFSAINTHLLLDGPLSDNLVDDRRMIYNALAAGHCFVAYDLPFPTRGFRFNAHGRETAGIMGDQLSRRGGLTLQAWLPSFAEIRLIHDGKVLKTAKQAQALTWLAVEPGVYRIEAYKYYLGRKRGWIFSNPIYVL